MTKRIITGLVLLIAYAGYFTSVYAQDNASAKNATQYPTNIILLIGDGMALPQIHAAMSTIAPNTLNMLRCNYTAVVTTNSADNEITDSGAGGTALATGSKTNNGYIGLSPDKQPLKSILKVADEQGLSTGMVATSNITHATPASFIANVASRYQLDDIAMQFLYTDIDVFIGGGLNQFAHRADKANLIDSLKKRNYQMAYTLDDLNLYKQGKLAGLLYADHPPKMLEERGNMLPLATSKALELLSLNDKGFFLMVEGSQIDWGGHDNDINYVTSELIDFDNAVGIALDFADKNPGTLVIVTADHETGGLTLIRGEKGSGKMVPHFSTKDHTALPVMLFAYGTGAEKYIGMIDNTDLLKMMVNSFGFNKVYELIY